MQPILLKSLGSQAEFTTDFFHLANLFLLAQQFSWQADGPIRLSSTSREPSLDRIRRDPAALAAMIRDMADAALPDALNLEALAAEMLAVTRAAQKGVVPAALEARWDRRLNAVLQIVAPDFDAPAFLHSLTYAALYLNGGGYYSPGYAISRRDAQGLGQALLRALPAIPKGSRQVRLLQDAAGPLWQVDIPPDGSTDPLDFFGGRHSYVLTFLRFLADGPYRIA